MQMYDVVDRWGRVEKCSEMVRERIRKYEGMDIKDVIVDIKQLVESYHEKEDSWDDIVVDWDYFIENATRENTTLVVKPEATIMEEGMIKLIHELVLLKHDKEMIVKFKCVDDGEKAFFTAKVVRFGRA